MAALLTAEDGGKPVKTGWKSEEYLFTTNELSNSETI
jgi:hypothetical protein